MPMFTSDDDHGAGDSPTSEETIVIGAHARKKRGRKALPKDLPRIDIIHDLSEEQKQCGCGQRKSCIGEEISEKLDYIPARLQVERHIRLKYACKSCEGVEDDGPTVMIAPAAGATDPQKQFQRRSFGAHCRIQVCRRCAAVSPAEDIFSFGH